MHRNASPLALSNPYPLILNLKQNNQQKSNLLEVRTSRSWVHQSSSSSFSKSISNEFQLAYEGNWTTNYDWVKKRVHCFWTPTRWISDKSACMFQSFFFVLFFFSYNLLAFSYSICMRERYEWEGYETDSWERIWFLGEFCDFWMHVNTEKIGEVQSSTV